MPVDPNNWYQLRGMVNPFLIPDPWDSRGNDTSSLPAANKVASILHGKVIDNLPAWVGSGNPFPVPHRYTVQVNGMNFNVPDLAQMLTNDSPDQLRVDLNRYGITVLGPPPLPAAVSYPTNYDVNPLATDPGPVPSWAVSQAATATKPPIVPVPVVVKPVTAPVTGAINPSPVSVQVTPGPVSVAPAGSISLGVPVQQPQIPLDLTQGAFTATIPTIPSVVTSSPEITPITYQPVAPPVVAVQQLSTTPVSVSPVPGNVPISQSTPSNAQIGTSNIQSTGTTQVPTSPVDSNLNQTTSTSQAASNMSASDMAKAVVDSINGASNVWMWLGAGAVVLYLLFKKN